MGSIRNIGDYFIEVVSVTAADLTGRQPLKDITKVERFTHFF